MDDSTLVTRKDAANRDKQCDLRILVNHQISERICTHSLSMSILGSVSYRSSLSLVSTNCLSFELSVSAVSCSCVHSHLGLTHSNITLVVLICNALTFDHDPNSSKATR